MAYPSRSPKVYRHRRRRIRRLVFFLLLVTALYYFIHSGFFSLAVINFTGNENIPAAELEALMGLSRGINLWQLDTALAEQKLATHPLVAAARIKRHWPRALTVYIEERKPAALLVQDGSFYVVDGSGVVMTRVTRLGNLKLPLVSCPDNLQGIGPGRVIDHAGITAALAVAREVPPDRINHLQEIIAPAPDNLQLIWEGNIRVLFGDSRETEAKLARLQEVLQGLNGSEEIDYIDVSFSGPPVVKFKQDTGQGKRE